MITRPGRSCPLHYRYAARDFRRVPDLQAETLLIAGGLYGNPHALDAVLHWGLSEPGETGVVFNGDFHWFDIDPESFSRIDRAVLAHGALRGNVETELSSDSSDAGCGCAYPDWVGDAEVDRSNQILARLRETAAVLPDRRRSLGALSMNLLARVGDVDVAIVHGDAESLAGWTCSQEALREAPGVAARQLEETGARILASSHTCLPVLAEFDLAQGRSAIINNGAAGMPNFLGTHYGVMTRISVRPRQDCLYATRVGNVHVEAHPVVYDDTAWRRQFDMWWPPDSPAALSYHARMVEGPRYAVRDAVRGALDVRGGRS